jgi:sulfide:quinone oxidoreductase
VTVSITEITPDYSVSPQIAREDVAAIAARGFRAIMCNRPDGESPGQPSVEDVRAEAERCGLAFAFVPVISVRINATNVADFTDALAQLPTPVLAYCRSGARCQHLWMLAAH